MSRDRSASTCSNKSAEMCHCRTVSETAAATLSIRWVPREVAASTALRGTAHDHVVLDICTYWGDYMALPTSLNDMTRRCNSMPSCLHWLRRIVTTHYYHVTHRLTAAKFICTKSFSASLCRVRVGVLQRTCPLIIEHNYSLLGFFFSHQFAVFFGGGDFPCHSSVNGMS